MILYTNNDDGNKEKIYHKDLQRLAKNINIFIDIYIKKIYIEDKENYEVISMLKNITNLIQQGRYDQIIEDTSIISYEDPDDIPF